MKKAAILIDGGHLRVLAYKAGLKYTPEFIEAVAHECIEKNEELLKVLYYDCPPYRGKAKRPISGTEQEFKGSDAWLKKLAAKDYFAVRLGNLKFRGFKPKSSLLGKNDPRDDDFAPDFEQKGVDMRIGLDIAAYSHSLTVERLILITADTDCIPAMKYGRKAGLQVVLIKFPNGKLVQDLKFHSDFCRDVAWPKLPSQ